MILDFTVNIKEATDNKNEHDWSNTTIFSFHSPDVILCGWLGLKHQITN